MTQKKPLADLILQSADTTLFAPLCLDALSARIAQQAGFTLGYVSGGALGYAHAVSEALLSVDELTDVLRHVTARSDLAIIVDAGVGFGDAVHLHRAVQQFEAAGAAAVEIEDQIAPKRVSHHRGIEHLITKADMVQKVNTAAEARRGDMLIIARTGATHNEGIQAACDRAMAYSEAGADMILVMADNNDDWATLTREIDKPLVTFGALGARTKDAWRQRGVTLVIDPFSPQVLAVHALQTAYAAFNAGTSQPLDSQALFQLYNQLDKLAGFNDLYAIEDRTTERISKPADYHHDSQ